LVGAQEAEDEDRFRVFLGELATLSEATGQLQYRVRALEDYRLVDRCEVLEEKEGRINSEALNHLIIKGKNVPFLERGDDLQQRLKARYYVLLNQFLIGYPTKIKLKLSSIPIIIRGPITNVKVLFMILVLIVILIHYRHCSTWPHSTSM